MVEYITIKRTKVKCERSIKKNKVLIMLPPNWVHDMRLKAGDTIVFERHLEDDSLRVWVDQKGVK